jgi:hypothetical protein
MRCAVVPYAVRLLFMFRNGEPFPNCSVLVLFPRDRVVSSPFGNSPVPERFRSGSVPKLWEGTETTAGLASTCTHLPSVHGAPG